MDARDCDTENLNIELHIFEQSPSLWRLYTQLCFIFPVPAERAREEIVTRLQDGLVRLATSFPWLAGRVVCEGADEEGNSGTFKIVSFEKVPRLLVKDLSGDSPLSITALRRAGFPFGKLHENDVAPTLTLAAMSTDELSKSAPVFVLQANFVEGGLILTINGQHNTMDMIGQGSMMKLLSKACRKESFTPEEVVAGNMDRRNLFPLLDTSWQPSGRYDHQLEKPVVVTTTAGGTSEIPEVPPQNTSLRSIWVYFNFPAAVLTALKTLASESLSPDIEFVSTDDSLSAFIWQAVTRARLSRHKSDPGPKTSLISSTVPTTTFARAIDTRRFVDVPAAYPGALQNMTYSTFNMEDLVHAPLGEIASSLRKALDPKTTTLPHDTRALATMKSRTTDQRPFNITAGMNVSTDVMLSSWAQVDCWSLDFGLGLGLPECVRRPAFFPVESLFYLMPKSRDGEIAAGLCMREDELVKLREDELWNKFATYIG